MNPSRITIFAGHYGSGKTNLAVNYAVWLAKSGKPVTICDLDIVNPYFRTADFTDLFAQYDIALVASSYANSNLDVPSVPTGAQALFEDESRYGVIDLGGDDRGALALGRYAKQLTVINDYEMLLVVNIYRPLSRDIQDIIQIRREIESASGVPFTALLNNSNLGADTTARHITESIPFIQELSKITGLPVKMTAAMRNLGKEGIFPIEIYEKPSWKVR